MLNRYNGDETDDHEFLEKKRKEAATHTQFDCIKV